VFVSVSLSVLAVFVLVAACLLCKLTQRHSLLLFFGGFFLLSAQRPLWATSSSGLLAHTLPLRCCCWCWCLCSLATHTHTRARARAHTHTRTQAFMDDFIITVLEQKDQLADELHARNNAYAEIKAQVRVSSCRVFAHLCARSLFSWDSSHIHSSTRAHTHRRTRTHTHTHTRARNLSAARNGTV
jgi:hypothetical protein